MAIQSFKLYCLCLLWVVCVVLCVSSTQKTPDPDNPFIDYNVDLVPFQNAIRTALRKSGKLNSPQCSIPDGGVIFTLSNHHLFPLLRLRQQIMSRAGILKCIEQRFITVCLDKKCMSLCSEHNIVNCMLLVIPETPYSGFGTKASAYQKNSYNYIVWVKYEMFIAGLMVANELFYFDADVMVFANPFPDAQWGRDNTGKKIPGPYDIMYQRERGMKELGCGGSVNGGLFYLHNSTALHAKFFPEFMKNREAIINLTGRLDQDIIGDYVGLVKYCTLPVNRFMGHCVSSRDARGYDVKQIVTFHTNCVAGLENKLSTLKDFAREYFGGSVNLHR